MTYFYTLLFIPLCLASLSAQVFNESFESDISESWTLEGNWMRSDAENASSEYFDIPDNSQFLVLNDDIDGQGVTNYGEATYNFPIDISGLTKPSLSLEAFFKDGDFQSDEQAYVMVSTDGVNYELLLDIDRTVNEDESLLIWKSFEAPLCAYLGSQNLYLKLVYSDGGGWNYGVCFDKITISESSLIDRELTLLDGGATCRDVQIGTPVSFYGSFTNLGACPIYSLDMEITINGQVYTETIEGLDIPYLSSKTVFSDLALEIDEAITSFKVEIKNINGDGIDQINAEDNETPLLQINGHNLNSNKVVLVESNTGTWCPECPRAEVQLNELARCFPDHVAAVAVHSADPMNVEAYSLGLGQIDNQFPSMILNRNEAYLPEEVVIPFLVAAQQDRVAELRSALSFDEQSRTLSLQSELTPIQNLNGGFKLNVLIAEKNVQGEGQDYDQANAFSGGNSGSLYGYELLEDPVPSSQMVYQHVGRFLMDSFSGGNGDLPNFMSESSIYQRSYENVTVPDSMDVNAFEIITILLDDQNEVVDAQVQSFQDALQTILNTEDSMEDQEVIVFPNPAKEHLTVRYNMGGQRVYTMSIWRHDGVKLREWKPLSASLGEMEVSLRDFNAGVYFLQLQLEEQIISKVFVIQ